MVPQGSSALLVWQPERLTTEPGSRDAGLLEHTLVQTSTNCTRCGDATEGKHVGPEASQGEQWFCIPFQVT